MADRHPAPVHLVELALIGFRNHRETRIAPGHAPFVLLTGKNGAGKTNILEAISLLSVGRGLRGAALGQMGMQGGGGGFRIAASLSPDPALPIVAIRTATQAQAPERRMLKINGATAALSALSEWAAILWLTPAMDRLFAESASARRRFLDRLVLALEPSHARHASRYEAAMRARTRLLAGSGRPDPAWLTALETQMSEHGAALTRARTAAVSALEGQLRTLPSGPFPTASLHLCNSDPDEDLPSLFRDLREADSAAGRATRGPHRADLEVTHVDKAMPAREASTGEQKALLAAILLAHAALVGVRSGRTPILLLDEAVAHLDADRRRALFDRLRDLGGQTWLTGTDAALFAGLEAAPFTIVDGTIGPA